MCDETTEAENAAYLTGLPLSRRDLALGATGAAAALWAGCHSAPRPSEGTAPTRPAPTPRAPESASNNAAMHAPTAGATPRATRSRRATIDTPDGAAEGFFVCPEDGAHPGVLMWPDVAGLREAFERMATRLAAAGYAVLVVNPYYRSSRLPILTDFAQWRTPEGQQKIAPMRAALTPERITRDGAAFVAWLDAQDEVDGSRKLGTLGYCMSGPFTFRTAATSDRVGAFASFHGGGLVTDQPNSPHRVLPRVKAAALVCIAANDDAREPEAKSTLRQAFDAGGLDAEIEVYPAQHGWCVLDSPVYDEAQAERAWARLLATFEAHL